ncbi:MAG: Von Willebrand factor, type A [Candidatus Saccharibacteria bacterium GW2011_GWA2_46_10]|nr:MAG: Von Willebrand factor, type A [Candidatus Saccharibacteria bacterium GW2011_GWA2_46_10]
MSGKNFSERFDAVFPDENFLNEGLASIWARQKVKSLEASMYRGENPQTVEEITNLALAYSIVTKYTSFVAFEEKPVTDQPGKTVQVPVELPEGASYEGIFGEVAPQGMSFEENIVAGIYSKDVRDTIAQLINLTYSIVLIIAVVLLLITLLIKIKHLFIKQPTSKKIKILFWVSAIGIVIMVISWMFASYLFILNFNASLFIALGTIALILLLIIWLIIRTIVKALACRRNKPKNEQRQTKKCTV